MGKKEKRLSCIFQVYLSLVLISSSEGDHLSMRKKTTLGSENAVNVLKSTLVRLFVAPVFNR